MSNKINSPVLICTVGGSHAPIVTSIRSHQPHHVCFICTEGKAGSIRQITGKGNCIKKSFGDEFPSLPSIPKQAGLSDEQFSIRVVPPDDPDLIHRELRDLLSDLVRSNRDRRIVADYTGGTKSMTAALMLAALEFDEAVDLYMIAGQRANLVQVTDGTEIPVQANVDRIRFVQKRGVALAPWQFFGFAEAALSLESMPPPREQIDRDHYLAALAASRAFAAWDRFDHTQAQSLLKPLGSQFGHYLATLGTLTRADDSQHPAMLLDLQLNLERRAHRQQFDDAVARAYRLLEWTAQWLLKRDAQIDTSNIEEARIPPGLTLPQNAEGRFFAGLRNAWTILETVGNQESQAFAKANAKRMLSLLTHRNQSILAHGFQPTAASGWAEWKSWLDDSFLPFLKSEAQRSGIQKMPVQLPMAFPEVTR